MTFKKTIKQAKDTTKEGLDKPELFTTQYLN